MIDVAVFARHAGVSANSLVSSSRKHEIVDVRHMLHYCLVRFRGLSKTRAGMLTDRDHATVLHSVNLVDSLLFKAEKPDKRFAAVWEKVKDYVLRAETAEKLGSRGWKIKKKYDCSS